MFGAHFDIIGLAGFVREMPPGSLPPNPMIRLVSGEVHIKPRVGGNAYDPGLDDTLTFFFPYPVLKMV